MDKLYSWRARRAGGRITVTHSCGKIANIDSIEVRGNTVVAVQAAGTARNSSPGREFELYVPAPERERYGATGAALLRTDPPAAQEG